MARKTGNYDEYHLEWCPDFGSISKLLHGMELRLTGACNECGGIVFILAGYNLT